ncbi:hypothetical protein AGMMS49592_4620 [Endomicrobiia bacterium]|nr:hypothetical protein AGMMS49592_4620 [Endomicrobiia bacterium]
MAKTGEKFMKTKTVKAILSVFVAFSEKLYALVITLFTELTKRIMMELKRQILVVYGQ